SIVVIGNANVDLTTYLERSPGEGETVLGHDFTLGMGGKGANQAVAAARAGASVSFIGRIGEDFFGDQVQASLTKEGLDLQHMGRVETHTAIASIYVEDSGANRIAVYPGASATLAPSDAVSAMTSFPDAHYLVSQLEINQEVVLAALESAREAKLTTILNIAPYAPLIPGIVDNTTWLIANEVELEGLLGHHGGSVEISEMPLADIEHQISRWSRTISCHLIVTLGSRGAIGCVEDTVFSFEGDPVTATDTVGAGDCFVGYFVALLDQGLPWQQALAGGVIAAGESVERAGAQSSYPDRADAHRLTQLASQVSY
ncbi:ribokinase, partial [Pontimonas sp.]